MTILYLPSEIRKIAMGEPVDAMDPGPGLHLLFDLSIPYSNRATTALWIPGY